MNDKTMNKPMFHSIDIMRGIAILMVIFVHTSQHIIGDISYLKYIALYSQMGVQMFFIASAFTLCNSLDYEFGRNSVISNFYIRRYFRIAPGYYMGIIIYFIINLIDGIVKTKSMLIPGQYTFKSIIANLLFLNGLYAPGNNNIVPGGWSVGTEMLFYLIFPLIFLLYKKLQTRFKNIAFIIPVIILALVTLAEYIYCLTYNKKIENNGFLYFNILNQLPVFCVGISLYFIYKRNLLKKVKLIPALLMTAVLSSMSEFGFLFFYNKTLTFLFVPFISALSFAFLFVILQNSEIKIKVLSKIGVVSYSCYLLHFVYAYWLTSALNKIIHLQPVIMLFICYFIAVILTYFSSCITYKVIEQNGIKLGKNLIKYLNHKRQEKTFKVNAS